MDIYIAHPVTGEFLGIGTADPDPMDDGNWLIPAHAYLQVPPAPVAGQAIRRTAAGDAWELVDDMRGPAFEKATGREVLVSELGPLLESLTRTPPTTPYDVWVAGGWVTDNEALAAAAAAEVTTERDERLRYAATRIAPLQDAVDLGVASDAEVERLRLWKVYRVQLSRIEQQEGFPLSVEWPAAPST
jgi:hypothetical protein